jgi:hypothetical protein
MTSYEHQSKKLKNQSLLSARGCTVLLVMLRISFYRKNKVVTTFEKVFNVILEAHSRISHAQNPKSNLTCITETLGCYGVPVEAVKHFINTCPLVCGTL